MIDSLQPEDLDEIIPLLKNNFINPKVLTDLDLKRATVAGLMSRLGSGVMLLPDRSAAGAKETMPPFGEVLAGKIGYFRAGTLNAASLQNFDAALKNFATQKAASLILDLRASGPSNDFDTAASFAQRFATKGTVLFILRKPSAKEEKTFRSGTEQSFPGLLIVLVDGETAGPAEALAGFLHTERKAMILGQPSAGRAVEYSDLPLPSGKILRVAVSEVLLPDKQPIFPDGITPDVTVEMPATEKRQVFHDSLTKGMSRYVFENERPHLNEAALLAGTNPEIDAAQARQDGRGPTGAGLRDPVVQRAVDLVTSLAFLQDR